MAWADKALAARDWTKICIVFCDANGRELYRYGHGRIFAAFTDFEGALPRDAPEVRRSHQGVNWLGTFEHEFGLHLQTQSDLPDRAREELTGYVRKGCKMIVDELISVVGFKVDKGSADQAKRAMTDMRESLSSMFKGAGIAAGFTALGAGLASVLGVA
jgi:hypothetical protein